MPFKPMPLKVFRNHINAAGWSLEKGSIDHNLYDEKNDFACSIKITHGKNTKSNEIPAISVKKTENEFKKRGLSWPPKKK
jgi:hypothetical protein